MAGADVAVPFSTGGMREVQMWAGGSAGVAGECDLVSGRDGLPGLYKLNRKVAISITVIVCNIAKDDCSASGLMIIYLCDYCSYR